MTDEEEADMRAEDRMIERLEPMTPEAEAEIAVSRKRARLVGELDRVRWRDATEKGP